MDTSSPRNYLLKHHISIVLDHQVFELGLVKSEVQISKSYPPKVVSAQFMLLLCVTWCVGEGVMTRVGIPKPGSEGHDRLVASVR